MSQAYAGPAARSEAGRLERIRGDLRDAWVLARTELRTHARHVQDEPRKLLSVAALLFFMSFLLPLMMTPMTLSFGEQLATGTLPLGTLGLVFSGALAGGGYLGAIGGFNQPRVGAVGSLVQTSIPSTAVVLGRITNRTMQLLVFVLPAVAILLAGVAFGAGGILVPLLVTISVGLFALAGLVAGRILGGLANYVNERLQVSLWLKALGSVVMVVTIFVVMQALFEPESDTFGSIVSGAVLPGTPLQAAGETAFWLLGGAVSLTGVAVLVTVALFVPLGAIAILRFEVHMLVSDLGSDSATASQISDSRGVPDIFDLTPTTRAAWRELLRTRRDPRRLAHLTMLLFAPLGMLGTAIDDPSFLLSAGPPVLVLGGVVIAGAAYCLNPLGDERDQLPLLLTSTPSIGVLLRGRMLAGIVLGLVVAIGVGAPLGLVTHAPLYVVGQSLLAVFLSVVATGIALAFGATMPTFERREYMNVERAHPSTIAMLVYMFGGGVVGGVGLLMLWFTLDGAAPVVLTFGWIAYVVVLGLTALGGYRYAIGRMDTFALDDI